MAKLPTHKGTDWYAEKHNSPIKENPYDSSLKKQFNEEYLKKKKVPQPSSGSHLHQKPSRYPFSITSDTVVVLNSTLGTKIIRPLNINYRPDSDTGRSVFSIDIADGVFTTLTKGSIDAEELQFIQDQVENYSEDISEDFAAGILAAIAIFKGEKFLEDYLG